MFTQKKKQKKLFVLSVALLCAACLIFTGCSSSNVQTPSASNNQTDQNNGDKPDNVDNNMPGDMDGDSDNKDGDLHQRAEKIAEAVTKDIEQVKDARAVISDKMAYVSVSIDAEADADQSEALKEEVSSVVKKTDAEIDTVYVMEDADTFTRMKEIGDDIADGKPVSGFAEELKTMFARVIPTKE